MPPQLSKPRIVEGALEIADRDGLDAVSMRRLAGALGSGTMSLYRHVPGRDALLDAMLEAVYSELDLPPDPGQSWRARIEQLARAQRRMLHAHPWVATLVGSRPPLLSSFLRSFESSLSALLDAGLDITQAAAVSSTINAFVVGYALLEHAEREARRRTGLTKAQWRIRHAPLVGEILDSGDYPSIAQYVRHAQDLDPDAAFDAGLTAILDSAQAQRATPACETEPRLPA